VPKIVKIDSELWRDKVVTFFWDTVSIGIKPNVKLFLRPENKVPQLATFHVILPKHFYW